MFRDTRQEFLMGFRTTATHLSGTTGGHKKRCTCTASDEILDIPEMYLNGIHLFGTPLSTR